MTFSQQVPSFGCHPVTLARALAMKSVLWETSALEYVFPVIPHVKGFRLLERGHRPNRSLNMNSPMVTESGGSSTKVRG